MNQVQKPSIIGFEIRKDGKMVCRPGISNRATLTCAITCQRWHESEILRGTALRLTVTAGDGQAGQWLVWPDADLRVGDEVVIRIVEDGNFDPPTDRRELDGPTMLDE